MQTTVLNYPITHEPHNLLKSFFEGNSYGKPGHRDYQHKARMAIQIINRKQA